MKNFERVKISPVVSKRIALLDDSDGLLTLGMSIDHLAFDIIEDLYAIERGEKEEQDSLIHLKINVLNALSTAQLSNKD